MQESLFSRGFVDLGSAPCWDADRCWAPTFSGVLARDDGRFSCRPQQVGNLDFPPVLPSVGSSSTHGALGDISLPSVGGDGGRGKVVRGPGSGVVRHAGVPSPNAIKK